jgi:RNA polymerase sigma-70 factor (ECF subfamily)
MRRWEDSDDGALLAATPDDPQAFAVFYRRHAPAVLGFFSRRTHSSELALDLTAEVFASALEASPRFRSGPEPARAWLYAIARNVLTDSLRRGRVQDDVRRRLAMEPLQLSDEGLAHVDAAISDAPALELLESLPADQREAIQERVLGEREYASIAQQLACSESVVRQRVSRGLRSLRINLRSSA